MKYGLYLLSLMLGGCLASCGSVSEQAIEDTWTPIAYWEVIKGDSVMICEADKPEVETTLPLELIAEDYQVIKLGKEAEEYSELSDAFITDNYIGISCNSHSPLRLFKKDGTFVTQVGSFGEEENNGKYWTVSNVQIDEANNRIYIMPRNINEHPTFARKDPTLLVYDLKGNYLHEIPLACWIGFGSNFKVDTEKGEIIVIGKEVSPESKRYRTWVQDMKGNLIYGIYDEDKKNDDYFGYGTVSLFHTDAMETFAEIGSEVPITRKETEFLYHLNREKRRLVPKFQAKTKEKRNLVYELPWYYIVESTVLALSADTKTPKTIVNKKTLKGSHFNGFVTPEGLLLNQFDLLAKTRNGYFSLIEKESRILERIQKTDKTKLTKEQRKKLEQLYQQLNSDKKDDTILFMAKFKR